MAIIGQQPSRAYGFDGYVNVFPFPIVTTRAPVNGSDGGVNGQVWIDTTGQDAYTMVDSVNSFWINAGGGGALFTSLTVNPGPVAIDSTLTTITATANVADVFKLQTGGAAGTTSTFTITNGTGTSATSIGVTSTAGGVAIAGGLATVDAIHLTASDAAGGINVDAGTAGFDLDSTGQINLRSTQNAGTAVVVESTAGGVQVLASGAAAGEDIVITATGSSVHITSTEAAVDAIALDASDAAGGVTIDAGTGGIDIDTTGAFGISGVNNSSVTTTTGDLVLGSQTGSVQIGSGEDAIECISIKADAGTAETVLIASVQGTSATSVTIGSTVGGVTIETVAASKDVTLSAVAGSIVAVAGEAASDAITLSAANGSSRVIGGQAATASAVLISASAADGGITLDAGPTPGVTLTNGTQTAQILVGTGSPNGAVTAAQGSIFLNVAGGADTILYVNTDGAMAWTALTST